MVVDACRVVEEKLSIVIQLILLGLGYGCAHETTRMEEMSTNIKHIRANPALYRQVCEQKKVSVDIDRLLMLDDQIRPLRSSIESMQAERNQVAQAMRDASPEQRQALREQGIKIKSSLDEKNLNFKTLKDELDELLFSVPLVPRADVPLGESDRDNVEIRRWGEIPKFDFKIRDHVELGKRADAIDIKRGVKLAGRRSYVLRGFFAQLEDALLQFAYRKLLAKGFEPFSVPVLVREGALIGSGHFPLSKEQTYLLEKDELSLVGTSEVPLVAYHQDEILDAQILPLRYMARSSCFRREAGTYGKDTHGLFRVHQFQKVEQLVIGLADEQDSERLHAELLANSEELLQELGLPYRVVYVCRGDLGLGQYRKHDIETWMPSRNSYSETHSCSTLLDFQARRLNIRYRDSDQKKRYCYTLNNTAIATPRILIPLVECNQTADGQIKVPECLRPYL